MRPLFKPLALLLLSAFLVGLFAVGEHVANTLGNVIGRLLGAEERGIAPLFTEEVDYWADHIRRWAEEYDLEPNLLATVMQIESCGHPTIRSVAGAQGLFQVMPYHFAQGEDQLDPDTNVRRGAGVLHDCLQRANGDIGLALACYNGGPSVTTSPYWSWNQQAQAYYNWGTGIYSDALTYKSHSETLERWLEAGGKRLCDLAAAALRIE